MLDRYTVLTLDGAVQRGQSMVVWNVWIGPTLLQEQRDHGTIRGKVQRCVAFRILRIRDGIMVQQQFHNGDVGCHCSHMQGRSSCLVAFDHEHVSDIRL